jgi:hypothetical protein
MRIQKLILISGIFVSFLILALIVHSQPMLDDDDSALECYTVEDPEIDIISDTDNDGIYDVLDRCPNDAEDGIGNGQDGCPEVPQEIVKADDDSDDSDDSEDYVQLQIQVQEQIDTNDLQTEQFDRINKELYEWLLENNPEAAAEVAEEINAIKKEHGYPLVDEVKEE